MKTTPVRGTNDWLPQEQRLRDFLQDTILSVYRAHGFTRISTPIIEDINNLDNSDGGENLAMIFRILKRGDKLIQAISENTPETLADLGLRYDLTLPLSRMYSNNKEKLPNPFKCIQIDRVFRAERPQRGRDREFMQCDIDILGSNSYHNEIELIAVTGKAVKAVGIDDFTININDRRILRGVLQGIGFEPDSIDSVCITFDKYDKIGIDGVVGELREKNMPEGAISGLVGILEKMPLSLQQAAEYCTGGDALLAARELGEIIRQATEIAQSEYSVEYDLSLVRGQGYYTGPVFEIRAGGGFGSVGGGGRYDKLIGKFTGNDVPAVGFSIGFERIFGILRDAAQLKGIKKRIAVLYAQDEFLEAFKFCDTLRDEYEVAMLPAPKKFKRFTAKLTDAGYDGYCIFGKDETPRMIEE